MADVKISALEAKTILGDTDDLVIVDHADPLNLVTKRTTYADIKSGITDQPLKTTDAVSFLTVNGRDIAADGVSLDQHIANVENPHSVTKTQVGLSNVDNTADIDKPVSTAAQSALDLKQDILAEGAFVDGDKTKLDNVPLDTISALGLKEDAANKGVPNGYASLDAGGLVPTSQLPSYVDDIIEVATYTDLPAIGEAGKIYVVLADETSGGNTSSYRWTGTTYAMVSNTLTAADIKSLYESNLDTNVYSDADKSKLDGIEANATADQIANEVPYDNSISGLTATDVNGAIDEVEARVESLEADSHTHPNKAILDNIEVAYTTAMNNKLTGIESGATADMTPTEILTAIKTVDGTGSGLDADTLDGYNATDFWKRQDNGIQIVTDWNEAIENGHYYAGAGLTNSPTAEAVNWSCLVIKGVNDNNLTQIASSRDTTSRTYVRNRNAGTWRTWQAFTMTGSTVILTGDVTGTASIGTDGSLSLVTTVGNDSHTHSFANITSKPTTVSGYGITDAVQEGDSVTLTGDVSGTATFDSDGNINMVTTVADDSHTHDTRYYTEAELAGIIGKPSLSKAMFTNGRILERGIGTIGYTADTTSTFIDRYSRLRTAAIGESRHNAKGMRFDAASTNLQTNSEDPNLAFNLVTTVYDSESVVFGGVLMHKYKFDANTGGGSVAGIALYDSQTYTTDNVYTQSMFVKYNGISQLRLRRTSVNQTDLTIGVIDVLNGTIVSDTNTEGNIVLEKLYEGVYRVSAPVKMTTSATSPVGFRLQANTASDADGTNGVWAGGAQLEALPYVTSYIPTTDTTVTRAQSVTSLPTIDNMPDISKGAGLFMEFTVEHFKTSQQLLQIAETNLSNSFSIAVKNTGNITIQNRYNSATVIQQDIPISTGTVKLAIAFSTTDVKVYVNSQLLYTSSWSANGIIDTVVNRDTFIGVYLNGTSSAFTGYIKSVEWVEYTPSAVEVALRHGGN